MSLVFSRTWQRNPSRLLNEMNMSAKTASEEALFLTALEQMPHERLGNVCLVMGGFCDGFLGRAYRIVKKLPDILGAGFDVYYREHDEWHDCRRILMIYGVSGHTIVGMGHSWGGSSLVLDVLGHSLCRKIPVQTIITLDPVSRRKPCTLPAVQHWLNVYVPYDRAPWSRENNVARIGGPWEFLPQAERNAVSSGLRHSDAAGMFEEYGESFLLSCLADVLGRKATREPL